MDTFWIVLFVNSLVLTAIGLIASSGKRLDSTEGEEFEEFLGHYGITPVNMNPIFHRPGPSGALAGDWQHFCLLIGE